MLNNKPIKKNNSGGSNKFNSGNSDRPSPWIDPDNIPKLDPSASFVSFVEYLRWMRSFDPDKKEANNATKVQILQMAEEKAKTYKDRLTELTNRTKLIAGENNTFQVKCTWRVRVGGHRGPESILLPAFDALGIPYIPSSTLRGVARNQAIRHFMAEGMEYKQAVREIASFFGDLDAKRESDRAGKVIFLDAYPLPSQLGVLSMDMANNIWKWEGDFPEYKSNPNSFLSLKESTVLIGIKPTRSCNDETFNQVKTWLISGLQAGIGSQVNTGYGEMLRAGESSLPPEIIQVDFTVKGQLIHGSQKFANVSQPFKKDKKGNLKPDISAQAEVRTVAFKSMLRYWFRVFALGVLPAKKVQDWEPSLFGAIYPQKYGWVKFNVFEGRKPNSNIQEKNNPCLQQEGTLTLTYSSEAPENQRENIKKLMQNLTWLMFHLGGIGQGARRPCYSRQNRQYAPWYRGSTLMPDRDDYFWQLPSNLADFQKLFQQRLIDFYTALAAITGEKVNGRSPLTVGTVTQQQWREVADINCRIVVCSGQEDFGKPYALAVLHSEELKIKVPSREGKAVKDEQGKDKTTYNGDLCGKVSGSAKPSPVWITDLGNYQVVTVFGATKDPRKNYLTKLCDPKFPKNSAQIFPM